MQNDPGLALLTGYNIFLNITHQPMLRGAWLNMALFFFRVSIRKFSIAREQSFQHRSRDKKKREALVAPSSNYLLARV